MGAWVPVLFVYFFFQAEDGIRDDLVTGVQTCAFDLSGVKVTLNGKEVPYTDAKTSNPALTSAIADAGYPKAGNPGIVKMAHPFDVFRPQVAAIIGLLFILVIFVTMVYGPIAAMLVELFPTKIRYTSMSLPYHIGNGWFGGLLPATAFAIVAST